MTKDTKLIKSKSRVRDHWEVYTPEIIVEQMLNLVKNETERIESKFLEPACGTGNFLIKILDKKLKEVERKYKKIQSEFEFYSLLAIWSIYGIDLLADNIQEARSRLKKLILNLHTKLFKKKNKNREFEQVIRLILKNNIIQGDALTLKNAKEQPLLFSDWWSVGGYKIKRSSYIFEELIPKWEICKNKIFIPEPINQYPPVYFLSLYKQAQDEIQLQSWCTGSDSKSQQWWSIHTTKISKYHAWSPTKGTMVGLFN